MPGLIEQVMGTGKGGSILVRIGTNNADREGTTAIVKKYRNLSRGRSKRELVSWILPVGWLDSTRDRRQERRIQELEEDGDQHTIEAAVVEDVGFVDLWSSFVAKEEMYMKDVLHLNITCAGVFADGSKQAVDSGLGNVHYLN